MLVHIQGKHGIRCIDINRKRAVPEYCYICSGYLHSEVENCSHKDCPLYMFRSGKGKQESKKRDQAIRKNCIYCSGTSHEVKKCTTTICPLWSYRNTVIDRAAAVPSPSKKGLYSAKKNTGKQGGKVMISPCPQPTFTLAYCNDSAGNKVSPYQEALI